MRSWLRWDCALCQRIGEPRYQLWFHDKTVLSWDQDRLVVGVPNRFFQEWLDATFLEDVRTVASDQAGRPVEVLFNIDPKLFQAFRQKESGGPVDDEPRRAEGLSPPVETPVNLEPRKAKPRRWRRLEEFVVGPCNRVAHASAQSVVETPGQGPNPLVLHGPVGNGKTHLLEGIYLGLRHGQTEARVILLTAEDFTNRFVQAMRTGKLAGFRKQFREADALLMDDIHFLAKKLATQEEFLHTFDALVQAERPVVVTCDCHPRLADQFMPELTDRLLGGAIWGLNLPEQETRLAILRTKSARRTGSLACPENSGVVPGSLALPASNRTGKAACPTPVPEAVLAFLAEQLRGNVRELEGALHALDHYARVTARPITIDLAREALAEVLRHSVRVVQLDDVERIVTDTLGLEKGALRNGQRGWMYSHPRMLAVYLARKHTPASYTEIGQQLGGRSHSTAVAAEKKVRAWLTEDASLSFGQRRLRVRRCRGAD